MQLQNGIHIICDGYGHIYLSKDLVKIYELSITNKNILDLYEIYKSSVFDYVLKTQEELQLFRPLKKYTKLKNKIFSDIKEKTNLDEEYLEYLKNIKEKEFNDKLEQKYNNSENFEETESDLLDIKEIESEYIDTQIQYCPEYLEFIDDIDDNDYETYYKIYCNIDNFNILKELYVDENVIADYDSFLYQNNDLVFVSKLNIYNPSFRILIYDTNKIILKVIDKKDIIYSISYNDLDNSIILNNSNE
jgi:hypothetical protein